MTDRTNKDRAADAAVLLHIHSARTGIEDEPLDTELTDLLCNLMHWCDDRGVGWQECLNRASGHYVTEHNEENCVPPPMRHYEVTATREASYSAMCIIKAYDKMSAQAMMRRRIGAGEVEFTADDVPMSPADIDLSNIVEVPNG